MEPSRRMIDVPGGALYCELRGSGPLLVLIPGGGGDAEPFAPLASSLARRYTVLSYERRGFSRSVPAELPARQTRLAADADDAAQLVSALALGPADVFGSSSGAIVGLTWLARYPESIRTLVAHEPPLLELAPDAARHLAFIEEVYRTYQRVGVDAAIAKFTTGIGLVGRDSPPGAEVPPALGEMLARIRRNQEFFLEHELRQYTRARPSLERLRAFATRIVLASGRDSRAALPALPNDVLAAKLGSEVVEFPGGHIGYVTHPGEFAERLLQVLAAR